MPRCQTIACHPIRDVKAGPHTREAYCDTWGTHIQWVSRLTLAERQIRQEKVRLAAMAQLLVTERQWNMLRYLGDTTSSSDEHSLATDTATCYDCRDGIAYPGADGWTCHDCGGIWGYGDETTITMVGPRRCYWPCMDSKPLSRVKGFHEYR